MNKYIISSQRRHLHEKEEQTRVHPAGGQPDVPAGVLPRGGGAGGSGGGDRDLRSGGPRL